MARALSLRDLDPLSAGFSQRFGGLNNRLVLFELTMILPLPLPYPARQ